MRKVLDDGGLEIAPLRNLPVIRDLVDRHDARSSTSGSAAEGVFHPTRTREDEIERIGPGSPMRIEANAGIECINCGVCYAACDVVADNPDYLGPAALNRAWTLVNDQRDGAARGANCRGLAGRRLPQLPFDGQLRESIARTQLNPTASIAGLKRETVKAVFRLRR